jgi:hypothetical protein
LAARQSRGRSRPGPAAGAAGEIAREQVIVPDKLLVAADEVIE